MTDRDPPEIRTDIDTEAPAAGETELRRADTGVPSPDEPASDTARLLELPNGEPVDHFKILRRVGRGGMGEVYLARDTRLGRRVAIKVLAPAALGSRDGEQRFLFEAQSTARFSHPHIVTVHHVGEHAGRPYLAMEYLEGETLRARLDRERLGTRAAVRYGLAIADALREAHRHGLLHRDLKPGNVMIPSDGRLRVVDFGLAKRVDAQRASGDVFALDDADLDDPAGPDRGFQTVGRKARGTPYYMAPEQWTEEQLTPATDVWALGLLLHEMLAGRHPFAGMTALQVAHEVTQDAPMPPLREGAAPRDLRELVARCLDKDPAARPTTEELVPALEELLGQASRRPPSDASPYRGLLPFGEAHAELFFGRDVEIASALERLRGAPVLPVVGPSGVGKSSFVAAGLIPRLREQARWRVLQLRPGARPFRALAARLITGEVRFASAGGSMAPHSHSPGSLAGTVTQVPHETLDAAERELTDALAVSPGNLALRLLALADEESEPGDPAHVLLFVDQLEELFTLVDDPAVQEAFLEAVCRAADDPDGPLRVVFTIREDFLGRLAPVPAARAALAGVTVLGTPDEDQLVEALRRPAALVGYAFDDDALPREMAAEVHGEAAALPLLQFAGRTLWDRRDREAHRLSRAVYQDMGGVAGCLARHADGLVDGLAPDQVRAARSLLLRLVTPQGTRRVTPRSRLLEGLGDGAPEVLDLLVRERLVLARRARSSGADEAQLELVHEALVQSWRRLARWIEESREELAFLAQIEQAADLWVARGCRDEEVWRGEPLAEASSHLAGFEVEVPADVRRFVAAGERLQQAARSRRMGWSVAAVVGIIALLTGGAALIQHLTSPARLCGQAEERLAGTWDDDRRAQLTGAFLASGSPHAEGSADRVTAILDDYAARWAETFTEACEATHVHGEQSEAMLDRRMTCLDRRRSMLQAQVDLLTADVDEAVVDRAAQAAYSLPSLARCSDLDALAAALPPPEDPVVRARVEELQGQLDQIRALDHTGRYRDAYELIQPLAGEVRAVGHPPTTADALYRLGVLQRRVGELDAAERTLTECARIAAEAGYDELMASAVNALAIVSGSDRRNWEVGIAWYRAAQIANARAGNDPADLALLHNHMGVMLCSRGELDAALEHYEEALELGQQGLGELHPKLADYHNNIGVWYARQGRFEEAMPHFERSAEITEATVGPGHPDMGNHYNNLGLVAKNIGDHEGALELLQRSAVHREATLGEDHTQTAVSYNNLGELLLEMGDHEAAQPYFERTIEIETRVFGPEYPALGYPLNGLAECHLRDGRPADGIPLIEQAIANRQRVGADEAEIGESRFVLAQIRWALGERAEATRQAELARASWAGKAGWEDELALLRRWETEREP